jgi:hypothetical protein
MYSSLTRAVVACTISVALSCLLVAPVALATHVEEKQHVCFRHRATGMYLVQDFSGDLSLSTSCCVPFALWYLQVYNPIDQCIEGGQGTGLGTAEGNRWTATVSCGGPQSVTYNASTGCVKDGLKYLTATVDWQYRKRL